MPKRAPSHSAVLAAMRSAIGEQRHERWLASIYPDPEQDRNVAATRARLHEESPILEQVLVDHVQANR